MNRAPVLALLVLSACAPHPADAVIVAPAAPPSPPPAPAPSVAEAPEAACVAGPEVGAISGVVELARGGAPASFTVFVGRNKAGAHHYPSCEEQSAQLPAQPGDRGAFRVDGLPPGSYHVRIEGPGFVAHEDRAVVVAAGAAVDLHRIALAPGRTLSGRVLDPHGAPVAGAEIVAGASLWGDGAHFHGYLAPGQPAKTGPDGRFALSGLAPDPLVVAAEQPGGGRSAVTLLAAGAADLAIELALLPPLTLEGKVTHGGGPAAGEVRARPLGIGRKVTLVANLDASGRYRFERLAPGDYVIVATLSLHGASSLAFPGVAVPARLGAATHLDLDVPRGQTIELAPIRRGVAGDQIVCTLVDGEIVAATSGEVDAAVEARDEAHAREQAIVSDSNEVCTFEDVAPGHHTACVSLEHPTEPSAAKANAQPARCQALEVTARAGKHTVAMMVP